ncbi:hypothetical protein [Kitasatospora sp. A2-31]|uniref:hypothetical protein n=1 Tax=Kitasatospora sp. A2-31 TaxID=2916414 RepID=UPI001EEBE614|nr:hypothetical protein [Kitasatospora sp. A2-31]MCG6494946.1 hypothetical protein [Kitasatospora sp. A2-31]
MSSILRRITADDRREAASVLDDFKVALAAAGTELPSTGIDWNCASVTGVVLIDLGAAPVSVVTKLTDVIRDGVRARREPPRATWYPRAGQAVTLNTADGAPLAAEVVVATQRLVTIRLDGRR